MNNLDTSNKAKKIRRHFCELLCLKYKAAGPIIFKLDDSPEY